MNRRDFLEAGFATGIYSAHSELVPTLLRGLSPKPQPATYPTPDWFANSPTIIAGCWDDFPLYQKRRGGTCTWLSDLYRRQRSPSTIKALKDAGITLAILHFFKGFGLQAEHDHIQDAREISRELKVNGIRVGLYVGSTIGYETFLLERPDAEEWFVPDYLGKPVYYGHQPFRRRVYFMHPGYRAYINQVIRYGLEELDADLIHLDNTSEQAQPSVFLHPLAIEDFRAYLSTHYSPEEIHDRLGFSDTRHITAPALIEPPVLMDDPLLQLWTEFRCHQLTDYYTGIATLIRSVKPDAVAVNNPSAGVLARNMIWQQAIDYPRLLGAVHGAWTEVGDIAHVRPDGAIVSKICTLKAASLLGNKTFCYTWGAGDNWGYSPNRGSLLEMAQSMAYNRQCLGMVGIVDGIHELPPEPRRYIQFYRDHFELYRKVESVADVALLYSSSSIGYNMGRPVTSFFLASQMLIHSHFLFNVIFDQHLDDLSRYRVLFLADQESLSDQQIEQIRAYVRQGGGLVATGHTSLYTERRLRRPDYGLKDCFGASAPRWYGSGSEEPNSPGGPSLREVGRGKVSYIPEIIPPAAASSADPAASQPYWSLARNNSDLVAAVSAVLQRVPTIQLSGAGDRGVVFELVHQAHANRFVLHVINFDHANTPLLRDLAFRLTLPHGRSAVRLYSVSPDAPDRKEQLTWTGEQELAFRLPVLQIYSVVAIELAD